MYFKQSIDVLSYLAGCPAGATAGKIQTYIVGFTRPQVNRIVKELVGQGYIRVERVPYRPHINAQVFHITPKARMTCETLIWRYDQTEHQLPLMTEASPADMPF